MGAAVGLGGAWFAFGKLPLDSGSELKLQLQQMLGETQNPGEGNTEPYEARWTG